MSGLSIFSFKKYFHLNLNFFISNLYLTYPYKQIFMHTFVFIYSLNIIQQYPTISTHNQRGLLQTCQFFVQPYNRQGRIKYTVSLSNIGIPIYFRHPSLVLGIKRRSESLIETLLSGQRGNVFSIYPFYYSIFKEGCRD